MSARSALLALASLLALCQACGACERSKPPPLIGVPGQTGSGSIAGTVHFAGQAPPLLQAVSRGAFSECAGGAPRTSSVQLSAEGNVGEVVVYVKGGLTPGDYPVPPEPVTLGQRGCEFEPRVFALRAGQKLILRNQDPALHNVHALGLGTNAFNFSMPQGRPPLEQIFGAQQIPVTLTCDVHPWMRAYAAVLAHPFFAVTGSDGAFALRGLPAGTYQLEAWHERLGRFAAQATVPEGGSARVDFDLR